MFHGLTTIDLYLSVFTSPDRLDRPRGQVTRSEISEPPSHCTSSPFWDAESGAHRGPTVVLQWRRQVQSCCGRVLASKPGLTAQDPDRDLLCSASHRRCAVSIICCNNSSSSLDFQTKHHLLSPPNNRPFSTFVFYCKSSTQSQLHRKSLLLPSPGSSGYSSFCD